MLRRLFQYSAKTWVVVTSLILTLCLFIIIRKIDELIAGRDGMGVLHLQFSFVKEYFVAVAASWGNRGIDIFLHTIWLDFLFPVCYAVLLGSFYTVISGKDGSQGKEILRADLVQFLLPYAAALFDFIENGFHILILSRRWFFDSLILAGSIAALIKWSLLAAAILMIVRQYLRRERA